MTKIIVAKKVSGPAAKHKIKQDSLSNSAQKVLNAAAALLKQRGDVKVSKDDVKTVSEIKGYSTFLNALTELKRSGVVLVEKNLIMLTDNGFDQADLTGIDISIPQNTQVQCMISIVYCMFDSYSILVDLSSHLTIHYLRLFWTFPLSFFRSLL
jgi:hypothetical protein